MQSVMHSRNIQNSLLKSPEKNALNGLKHSNMKHAVKDTAHTSQDILRIKDSSSTKKLNKILKVKVKVYRSFRYVTGQLYYFCLICILLMFDI